MYVARTTSTAHTDSVPVYHTTHNTEGLHVVRTGGTQVDSTTNL